MSTPQQRYKQRLAARRAEARTRLGGVCVRCGSTDGLEFDHVDPATKLFNVGRHQRADDDEFWAEVVKCQLLCSPCHHEKTKRQGAYGPEPKHGTISMYHGRTRCRCEPCRGAAAAYARERRQRV